MEGFVLNDLWPIAVAIFAVVVVIGIVMWMRRPRDPDAVPIRPDPEAEFEKDAATKDPPD